MLPLFLLIGKRITKEREKKIKERIRKEREKSPLPCMLDINKMLQIQGMYALARGGVKLKFFISTGGSIMWMRGVMRP